MPTGYTADIANGISFEEYALRCARNFGALIMMRDDPMNAAIPDKFEPSEHNKKGLDEANEQLAILNAASSEDLEVLAVAKYKADLEYFTRARNEKSELLAKYEAMLGKAKAYIPPSDQHLGYAKFLVSQIEESIGWDCDMSYPVEPVKLTGDEYKEQMVKKLEWDISYHANAMNEEIDRTNNRTKWVQQLKSSLHLETPQP